MASTRVPSSIVFALLIALLLPIFGCGEDYRSERYESEETRAIREKVRAEMANERLERIGNRLAVMNESLASSPNAYALSAGDASEGEEEASAGISLASGEEVYTANCSSCHGARGEGDGPLSGGLQPQPAKHADGGYMNALSNDHIYKVIAEGGAAVGKSSMMAPWGTSLSDDEINSLVVFIRTLADPPYSGPVPGES
ncbi:MAG: cytochrome c [bacterium]|nr:cytochrome c [bacterium]